jgi:RimJ/RimL family protein N-acetyltransferase
MIRHEYRLTPENYRSSGRSLPDGFTVRRPTAEDRLELASLMMDAYIGTIDYAGENEDQAAEEVDGYLVDEALLDMSVVAILDDAVQSAVLLSRILGLPLVGYAMTRATLKGQGLASALLDMSVSAVWDSGAEELRAFITAGNVPSEKIFERAGFKVIGTYGED